MRRAVLLVAIILITFLTAFIILKEKFSVPDNLPDRQNSGDVSHAPKTIETPDDKITKSEITFSASDGYRLSGTFWQLKTKIKSPTIILAHQFNSDRHDFDSFIPLLLENGYAVLAYDIRGFGQSRNGAANISDFPKDVEGAVAFLKHRPEVDSGRIGILGASVGANVAFVASGSMPGIRASVLLSPSNTGTRGVLLGNEISGFAPKNILVASDEREKPDADFIFARSSSLREQKTYPGFGHGRSLLGSQDARRDIIAFLERALKP